MTLTPCRSGRWSPCRDSRYCWLRCRGIWSRRPSSAGCDQLRWLVGGLLRQVLAETGPLSCRGWWWDRRGGRLLQTYWRWFGGQNHYVLWGHSRQQTVLPGQSFSQSLSWLSVGEGQTGSCRADIAGTLPVQGPWWHGLERRWRTGWRGREPAHTLAWRRWLWCFTVWKYLSCRVVVELANQVHELGRAPQLGQNHPKGLSVDRVEGFRQVYEDGNEVHSLFDALFPRLTYIEDHVGGAAVWTESTLSFRQVSLRNVGDEAFEDDQSQDLPSDGQERDAPVVAAVSLTTPVLE